MSFSIIYLFDVLTYFLSSFSCIEGQDAFLVRKRLTRLPLKMDAPERILCQAHVQARSVADFLNENGELQVALFFIIFLIII